MKSLLKKLLTWVAYLAAGLVILLAIAVGLFRLMLPRLPAYQEEIKDWANAAIGMQVEFSGMNARWRFSGPELNFYNAELVVPGEAGGAFAADEVGIGVDLMQLLLERRLVVDRVVVRDSAVDVRRGADGSWLVQGVELARLADSFTREEQDTGITVIAEEFAVSYRHAPDGAAVDFTVDSLRMTRRPEQVAVDVVVSLPESLGGRLDASMTGRPRDGGGIWQYSVDTRGLNLAGWSGLQPDGLPVLGSGSADVNLSFEQAGDRLRNAVIEFDVEELTASGSTRPFGAEGRIDYRRDPAGWLLVAENFRLRTAGGIWPEARINVQGSHGADGELQSLSARASYLNLDDLALFLPWLPERAAAPLRDYTPSGEVDNLSLSLSELGAAEPRYDLALELRDAGIAASERLPGLRGFTGSLRANRSGGRVEIDAADLTLELARWLEVPLDFTSAQGTVIWRRNRDGIIVLSDSIRVQNADLTSRSSMQLSLPADGSSPMLDLESRWSVYDIAAAGKYLPAGKLDPRLHRWLTAALVAGSVPSGVTRFSGPLAKFPFDDGEGVFRVEAQFEDATLRYSDRWPAVENLDMELVVDRTRLYSVRNTANNAGNTVVDADIEIADLRRPVLTIDAFATGTLSSVRTLARESPIANVFGGHLDRIDVAGDASFTLELRYPILDRENYGFTVRLQAADGRARIDGFPVPVEAVNGIVTISRDDIGAESLFGRFLGEPVSIGLRRAGDEQPGYGVIADIGGRFTAAGLTQAFGAPLEGVIDGGAEYRATLRFPRREGTTQEPFVIEIESALEGLAIELPAPLAKAAAASRPLAASIEFPEAGRIEARGSLADALRWTLEFLDGEAGWDFDRGVLAVGGGYPATAETRGLHVAGNVETLRMDRWLDIAESTGGGQRRGSVSSRIRSIDLNVAHLHVLGQHYRDHRVLVDRSGVAWVVQFTGEQVEGSVSIPYDLGSDRPIALDMQRLALPGDDEEADTQAPFGADPRSIPPVSVRADAFALGARQLGRVSADFERTADGLVAANLSTEDDTFRIAGRAGWVVDLAEPSGQRSFIDATLTSSDVAATMQRLDTRPGVDGEDMEVHFDVSWSGGPRADFLPSLDGNVDVRLGTGQLDEVEPGAGRMFGLLSIVALPRRLALDFRDVLDKGFLFDEITGTFRLEDGNAYTCDLSLKGPSADIGIVGRAGLVDRDYTQSAIVSADVGNTLPVVGAVVAGPQVAAALLIFSQIFKKPLQEMGQIYYGIDGNWDDPVIDSVNARRFADVSRMAGCLDGERS